MLQGGKLCFSLNVHYGIMQCWLLHVNWLKIKFLKKSVSIFGEFSLLGCVTKCKSMKIYKMNK